MNIYLISQTVNDDYDTYDSAVVAAEDERQAQTTYPDTNWRGKKYVWKEEHQDWFHDRLDGSTVAMGDFNSWCHPDKVTVKWLGVAVEGIEAGPICASFNAG
jgi:hypothetical protein